MSLGVRRFEEKKREENLFWLGAIFFEVKKERRAALTSFHFFFFSLSLLLCLSVPHPLSLSLCVPFFITRYTACLLDRATSGGRKLPSLCAPLLYAFFAKSLDDLWRTTTQLCIN